MDATSNLQLPFIMAAQAQKHVTHKNLLLTANCTLSYCFHVFFWLFARNILYFILYMQIILTNSIYRIDHHH